MEIQKLKRVFIHEVGHFVARELNYEIFNIGEGVEKIFIKKVVNQAQEIDFLGGTTPKVPKDYVPTTEIHNLPEYLAVLIYGCIFQTIYMKTIFPDYNFHSCFNLEKISHGYCDCKTFVDLENKRFFNGTEIVSYSKKDFFEKISKEKSHLNKIIELNPLKYLIENNTDFEININILKSDLNEFMVEHRPYYKDYISFLNSLIKKER